MALMEGFFRDKRAFDKLMSFLIYLVIVAIILLGLWKFINTYVSEESLKEQVLAKQIALMIDSSEPGTQMVITKGKFIVSVGSNEVNVKASQERLGYTYSFFTRNKVEAVQKEGILTLKFS